MLKRPKVPSDLKKNLFIIGHKAQYVGSYFPYQGSNCCPVQWKSVVYWMAGEVPQARIFKDTVRREGHRMCHQLVEFF